MEVDERGGEPTSETQNPQDSETNSFTLEVLHIIKEAQQQHGLRHGDYQRYRSYCSRRVRRIRKSLHFQQGQKNHYKPKKICKDGLEDVRYLYIPLMCTERCWSYAMQLKSEANTEPRKRFHMISKLRKAVDYAQELSTLCDSDKCDARTKLEVQAYNSWIKGSLEFELQNWKPAVEYLTKAKTIYEKLGSAFTDERDVYHQKVEEITPSIRYCAYNIGDESALDDLVQMRMKSGREDMLTSRLDELIAQTREKQACSLLEVTWLGRCIPIKNESVRMFLLNMQEGDKEISQTDDLESKVSIYESLLKECVDSLQVLRDELKTDPKFVASQRGHDTDGKVSNMQYLHTYLTYLRYRKTIERNLVMAQSLKNSLSSTGDGKISAKPQDLVRMYEIVIQNLMEIPNLPGIQDNDSIQREVDTELLVFKTYRCYYIGQSYSLLKKWPEALALYEKTLQYVETAMSEFNKVNLDGKQNFLNELGTLKLSVEESKYACHATSVMDSQSNQMESLSAKDKRLLVDRLEHYMEDTHILSRPESFVKIRPEFQPVACKPLFFDLALNHVQMPSLEDKMEQKKKGGITGLVTGWLGWGSKK